jgi:hypothetical protein
MNLCVPVFVSQLFTAINKPISKESMSQQSEAPIKEISPLPLTAKKLYSEEVQAELAELQSDIDLLFQQLQSLGGQRLMTAGSV